MERNYKIYVTSVIFLMFLALTLIFSLFKQIGLCVVSLTLLVVTLVYLISLLIDNTSKKNIYTKELNYILKTYKNILVKSLDLIDLSKKNIIRTDNIEDLVNAQVEIRKPIYYKCYPDCTTFILLQDKEALIYVIKENDNVPDPIDYFTVDTKIDLNEIEDKQIVKFRDKEIKIEIINKNSIKEEVNEEINDENNEDTSLIEFKKINKKRKKKNNKELLEEKDL